MLLRRTAGFDLHSVREYQQGESLRKVHWPTTARRGALMVKELEDMPHDEIAVLLDADSRAVVRRLVRRPGARGRVDPARVRDPQPARAPDHHLVAAGDLQVASFDGEWRALELLAAAEPTGTQPLTRFLGRDARLLPAPELVVVTASLDPRLVDALLDRAFGTPADIARLRRSDELPARRRAAARIRRCSGSRRAASGRTDPPGRRSRREADRRSRRQRGGAWLGRRLLGSLGILFAWNWGRLEHRDRARRAGR